MKRQIAPDEISDALEEDRLKEIGSSPWRHGRTVEYVMMSADGSGHWSLTLNVHHDDGIQIDGPETGTLVHQVERVVKVWEEVK